MERGLDFRALHYSFLLLAGLPLDFHLALSLKFDQGFLDVSLDPRSPIICPVFNLGVFDAVGRSLLDHAEQLHLQLHFGRGLKEIKLLAVPDPDGLELESCISVS